MFAVIENYLTAINQLAVTFPQEEGKEEERMLNTLQPVN